MRLLTARSRLGLCSSFPSPHLKKTIIMRSRTRKWDRSTSRPPAARIWLRAFNRAVALLHSFQYEQARQAFTEISEKDPQCAMAQWGVAMSHYHGMWDNGDTAAGRAALKKAQADCRRQPEDNGAGDCLHRGAGRNLPRRRQGPERPWAGLRAEDGLRCRRRIRRMTKLRFSTRSAWRSPHRRPTKHSPTSGNAERFWSRFLPGSRIIPALRTTSFIAMTIRCWRRKA